MIKNIVIAVIAVLVIVFGVVTLRGGNLFGSAGYGPTHYQTENFLQGLYAGTTGQFGVSNTGVLTTSGAATLTGAATFSSTVALNGETTLGNCGSASWNPGSVASSSIDGLSVTSTDIAVTGAALGDVCIASLSSATSTAAVFFCNISGTATGTITLGNTGATALDIVTGTAKICYFD